MPTALRGHVFERGQGMPTQSRGHGTRELPFPEVPRRPDPMLPKSVTDSGDARMSDTRGLLSRITDLRQRLSQAQGQLPEGVAGRSEAAAVVDLAERLEREVLAGGRVQALLDGSLRQIAGALSGEDAVRPTQLTARARRLLERARELVGRLRPLADDPVLPADDLDDPLVRGVRSAAAMTESAVRLVQAFPESPSAQLRLCEGLDG